MDLRRINYYFIYIFRVQTYQMKINFIAIYMTDPLWMA